MTARLIVFGLLCLCLTGCGFHLRKPAPLSPALQKPFVESHSPNSALTQSLVRSLRLAGATPVDVQQGASSVFVILSEQKSQSLLSVSSNQSSRQYRLSLAITFQITDPKGRVLIKPQTLSESRVLTMNSDHILSSSNETQILYQQIRMALVRDIMDRLTSDEISVILTGSKMRFKK